MTYRKNTRLGVKTFVELKDNGIVIIVMVTLGKGYIGYSLQNGDWENLYNEYSHCSKREFNDVYKKVDENNKHFHNLVKENI